VSPSFDCTGLYGTLCGASALNAGVTPEWRHKLRIGWNSPGGIGLSAQWRYFSAVKIDLSSPQAQLAGAFSPFNGRIPAQSYFDLTFTARLGDHYDFRLGVNNLFDRPPPIIGANGTTNVVNACVATFCSGNTFPNVYDALGRYLFAGVTLNF
ncbi:MAG TPA: TonB-dependent receptor, partial [Allosphingosinicella sp.]